MMLLTKLKCEGRAEKAFAKWLPGLFPKYIVAQGDWFEGSSIEITALFLFLRNKLIPGIF